MAHPQNTNSKPRLYARLNAGPDGDWVQCGHEDLDGHRCTGLFGSVLVHPGFEAVAGHGGRVLEFLPGFLPTVRGGDHWWMLGQYARKQVAHGYPPKHRRQHPVTQLNIIHDERALRQSPSYAVCPRPQCGQVNVVRASLLGVVVVTLDVLGAVEAWEHERWIPGLIPDRPMLLASIRSVDRDSAT